MTIFTKYLGVSTLSSPTTYYYWVQAILSSGRTQLFGPSIVTIYGILGNGNYIQVDWEDVPGATGYDILRTTTPNSPTGTGSFAIAVNQNFSSIKDYNIPLQNYTVSSGGSTTGITPSQLSSSLAGLINASSMLLGNKFPLSAATCTPTLSAANAGSSITNPAVFNACNSGVVDTTHFYYPGTNPMQAGPNSPAAQGVSTNI